MICIIDTKNNNSQITKKERHIKHIKPCYQPYISSIFIPPSLLSLHHHTKMASPSSSEFSEVIDWTEAMEQCGDDEEFLQELLGDLKGEIDTQIVKMDGVLEVSCMYV